MHGREKKVLAKKPKKKTDSDDDSSQAQSSRKVKFQKPAAASDKQPRFYLISSLVLFTHSI